ncbi:MAG: glycogen synthase GlgA [Ruminobacter sp.]|jgi:starch synthase|nr:glycogen synthase GlgA [Ruminobacter sp.]
MNVLYLTSELCDFVKTGGLADVAKALPLELHKRNHDVRIMMPCYSKIPKVNDYPVIADLNLTNPQNNFSIEFKVREAKLMKTVTVWLIDNEHYFNRNSIYAENNESYYDNGERFAFFSAAALLTTEYLKFCPQIIHCNDWHTALTPMILALKYQNSSFFAHTKTVITVHNGSFQGIFDKSQLWMLPELTQVYNESITHGYNNINFLKCGIYYANKINAVSPSYAEELTTFLGGHGMAQNYLDRIDDLCGIINGCDYSDWDPSIDPNIPFNFNIKTILDKNLCKFFLQEYTHLPVCNKPLFGMVCRLTDQKGINLLIPILDELLNHQIQLIIVGTGAKDLEKTLEEYTQKYKNKFVFKSVYDNKLAHLVEAGADFFLMPSIFEPCGLNQMYSLAYGTLPIVRAVGGLKDTIICYDDNPSEATGFIFNKAEPEALLNCIRRVMIFYLQDHFELMRVRRNAMRVRYDWATSASEYEEMYQGAISMNGSSY